MIYINRKLKADYSTVMIGSGDFIHGLKFYVRKHDWIIWLISTPRSLMIKKDENDPMINLRTFISWVSENGHQVSIRNERGDEWEEPREDEYL